MATPAASVEAATSCPRPTSTDDGSDEDDDNDAGTGYSILDSRHIQTVGPPPPRSVSDRVATPFSLFFNAPGAAALASATGGRGPNTLAADPLLAADMAIAEAAASGDRPETAVSPPLAGPQLLQRAANASADGPKAQDARLGPASPGLWPACAPSPHPIAPTPSQGYGSCIHVPRLGPPSVTGPQKAGPSPPPDQGRSSYKAGSDEEDEEAVPISSFTLPLPLESPAPITTFPSASSPSLPASSSPSILSFPSPDARPLRTASIRADTRLAHPRPRLITSSAAVNSRHFPGSNTRPPSFMGDSIAHLEATAERLSMTSSIDDAIRSLHAESKRNNSRQTGLAACPEASSAEAHHVINPRPASPHTARLKQAPSASSSIVSANNAAHPGAYSPAAVAMSPHHSLSRHLRSGSNNSAGRPDVDSELSTAAFRPENAATDTLPSTSIPLTEISESNPTTHALSDPAEDTPLPYDVRLHHAHLPEDDLMHPASLVPGISTQPPQDAFVDFDGVHCKPDDDENEALSNLPVSEPPPPRSGDVIRPQSYVDPNSGLQMLYYPARVPAMLSLPPRLSSRPKAAERNKRRSRILSAMMDTNGQLPPEIKRHSAVPKLGLDPIIPAPANESWLPEPVEGQKRSLSALASGGLWQEAEPPVEPGDESEANLPGPPPEATLDTLRRPQRLSRIDPEKRESRVSQLGKLPPQLRASVFFDLPSTTSDVEVKDGSAMATLDSILDASTSAPVTAFTDHAIVGNLGPEVYGREKKHKSRPSAATLGTPSPDPESKKRSSFLWFKKRSNTPNSEEPPINEKANPSTAETDAEDGDEAGRASPADEDGSQVGSNEKEEEEEDEELDAVDEYQGPPTTLLAELQLRKQEQQRRTKNLFPNGMHATLLEMDTVAETKRRNRQNKRVSLAWEEPDAHAEQKGSDDEDVPLAILAAMHHGAKNLADLERPMGLMARRELEDNEPLSYRRARLQGLEVPNLAWQKRQSTLSFGAPRLTDERRSPSGARLAMGDLEEGELEGRGAADDKDEPLPETGPISSSFSAELLSQFGQVDEPDKKSAAREDKTGEEGNGVGGEEETLGQRRRRLQAEREAREREMSYRNLAGASANRPSRRLSMADMLSAHPKRDGDAPTQDMIRMGEEERAARERDAMMAAMRKQMPQTLTGPNITRSGGFRGGVFNDGSGGFGPLAAMSSPAVNMLGVGQMPWGGGANRSSAMLNNPAVAMPQVFFPMRGAPNGLGRDASSMSLPYGGASMSMYGAGATASRMQMPLQTSAGSMDRVEQWRHGVHP